MVLSSFLANQADPDFAHTTTFLEMMFLNFVAYCTDNQYCGFYNLTTSTKHYCMVLKLIYLV